MKLTFRVLDKRYAVCRLKPGQVVPRPGKGNELWSATVSPGETSVVVAESSANPGWDVEPGWRAMVIQGPLDLNMTGVLAAVSDALAKAAVSIFVISTYDTDYVLVKEENLEKATRVITKQGWDIIG